MLVLSRKIGEQICIGAGIMVTVLEIQGHRVKVGIEAPRECRVLRGELHERADRLAPSDNPSQREPVRQVIAWLPCEQDAFEMATIH